MTVALLFIIAGAVGIIIATSITHQSNKDSRNIVNRYNDEEEE